MADADCGHGMPAAGGRVVHVVAAATSAVAAVMGFHRPREPISGSSGPGSINISAAAAVAAVTIMSSGTRKGGCRHIDNCLQAAAWTCKQLHEHPNYAKPHLRHARIRLRRSSQGDAFRNYKAGKCHAIGRASQRRRYLTAFGLQCHCRTGPALRQ